MKSIDVRKLLGISRVTLYTYVKLGKIKVHQLENGYYEYDTESVYKMMGVDARKIVLYSRVSTYKQKNDLNNQAQQLIEYCNRNNILYDFIYKEISSGLDLDRTKLNILIDDIIHYKIKIVYITHKDRLTRLSFKTLNNIFNRFGTKIIIIGNSNNELYDEIFEELISLIHIYSTRMYSNRKKLKFKQKNNIVHI